MEWKKWYFDWLWNEADPETGLWRKGFPQTGHKQPYIHMGGTFHYLFNHENARMPLRYPERLIDTCIAMYKTDTIGRKLRQESRLSRNRLDLLHDARVAPDAVPL